MKSELRQVKKVNVAYVFKFAHVVIDTTGTFEETRAKVENHFQDLKKKCLPNSTL